MDAIGPGSWVECVDASGDYIAGRLQRGQLYCIETVYSDGATFCSGCGGRGLSVTIVGVTDPGFCAGRFRPIWRGDKSLIETLLQPLSEHVGERV